MVIWIKYGKMLDPVHNQVSESDLIIEKNKITRIIPWDVFTESGLQVRIIDAREKLIIPGLIDMHVHLREPGYEYKETIKSGAQAGVAGGFTGLACMPNTKPVNDNPEVTQFILEQALKADLLNIYPIAAISKGQQGKKLNDFSELKKGGAIAVSDDGYPVSDQELMRQAIILGNAYNLKVISHCEDLRLSKDGVMHEGSISKKLGLKGISALSEEIMVQREVDLAKATSCPVHIAHVSTAGSVEIIRRAKEEGVFVTAETAPHYFTLNHEAVMSYDANTKINPPLRSAEDMEAIKKALKDDTLDVIATDHAPHSYFDKNKEFAKASFGIIGLETALPLTLALVREGILTLPEAIKKLSYNPAKILGINGGVLREGGPANLAVIDPDFEYTFIEKDIHSKSKNSPFIGKTLQGRNCLTITNGRVVWDVMKKGQGFEGSRVQRVEGSKE